MTDWADAAGEELACKIHFHCSHGSHGCSPACVVEISQSAKWIAAALRAERARANEERADELREILHDLPDKAYDAQASCRAYLAALAADVPPGGNDD